MKTDSVVLVTGGTGFLGQHVVKLLQTRADHVAEIRVLDVSPFERRLSYDAHKPVRHYVGSVTDTELVHAACRGVDCVIHLASYIDYSMFPDAATSHLVNVEGTRNIIEACIAEGVSRLIYGSSIEVVKSTRHEIFNGTEDATEQIPLHDFLFQAYGPSKKQAEDLVCQANGSSLKVVALRIMPMYGELEPRMAVALSNTVRIIGYYFSVNCGTGRTSYCYAGNTAWGILCADRALQTDVSPTESPAGRVFYIGDDTPTTNVFDMLKPMVKAAGYKQFPVQIPLCLLLYPLYLIYLILLVFRYFCKVNISTGIAAYYGMDKTYVFSYDKARRYLGYKPAFSYSEAKRATCGYYKDLLTKIQ